MAASRSYFFRANYTFLPSDREITQTSMAFEFDESDVWDSGARSQLPDFRRSSSRLSRKPAGSGPASLPVNIPDWSKILKDEYRNNRREDENFDYEEEEEGGRIPPHEFLARTWTAASVQEGVGRTLKGRDLSRVRNAIWQKIGFQD